MDGTLAGEDSMAVRLGGEELVVLGIAVLVARWVYVAEKGLGVSE